MTTGWRPGLLACSSCSHPKHTRAV
jgi:hypothetical protein